MAEYSHLGKEIQQLFVVKELAFVKLIQPSEEDCHKHMFVLHVVFVKVQLDVVYVWKHADKEL